MEVKKIAEKYCKNIDVIEPKKRNPLIKVFGVDNSLKDEEIIHGLIEENEEINNYFETNPTEKIENNLKIRTKVKHQKYSTNDVIIEINPKLYKKIHNKRSLYLDLRSYRFDDYISILKCFKCHRFGHMAINCKESTNICGNCSGSHETKQCNSNNTKNCINCHRFNSYIKDETKKLSTNHSVFDKNCVCLQKTRRKIIDKTNYE
jgi:hypothetical protein